MSYSFLSFLAERQELLNEIDMSPSALATAVKGIDARAGMEFELVIPAPGGSGPDMDYNRPVHSLSDIYDFFYDGNNGRHEVNRLEDEIRQAFTDFAVNEAEEDWRADEESIIRDYLEANEGLEGEELEDAVQETIRAEDYTYEKLKDEFIEKHVENADEMDFIRNEGWDSMEDVWEAYDHIVEWPATLEGVEIDQDTIEELGDDLADYVGMRVNASTEYHDAAREPDAWVIETDSSIQPADGEAGYGIEVVSPPLPVDKLVSSMEDVYKWARAHDAYTNKSTGLHISVSVPSYSRDTLDYVKLALLVGDQYILNQFGRAANTYTKSALGGLKQTIERNPEQVGQVAQTLKTGLIDSASKALHNGMTDKYVSLNTKNGYVEFRAPGGDWLEISPTEIATVLFRFVVALDAACDKNKYRQEYLKKLYKLLGAQSSGDAIALFAQYSAGEIRKQDLIMALKAKKGATAEV
jgi:hypothetical protein